MKTRAWDGERFREDYVVMPDGSVVVLSLDRTYGDKLKYTVPWKLSRFTGLIDKNGKEIYENHIVKIHVESCNQKALWQNNHIGFVTYDSESASYYIKNNFMKHWISVFNGISYEIIGDVFLNPGLLEVK